MTLEAQIEALLFWRGEPITKRELTRIFGVNLVAINDALNALRKNLDGRGIVVVENGNEVALATTPDARKPIEQFRKEELESPLGRAALETLSIILYCNGANRREIEHIRGVNSTSILRSLLIRGLITREGSKPDERVFTYRPTLELLGLFGFSRVEELPEYEELASELGSIRVSPSADEPEGADAHVLPTAHEHS